MEKLDKDLEALDERQAALQERTRKARERFGGDMDAALALWREAEVKAQAVADGLKGVAAVLNDPELPTVLPRTAGDAVAEAEGLLDSIRARDLPMARGRVERAEAESATLQVSLGVGVRRVPTKAMVLNPQINVVAEKLRTIAEVQAILDRLARSQSQSRPELARELQQLAAEQEQVAQGAEQAAKDAGQIARNLPMKAPGLERGAEQGASQSSRAAEAMQQGDPNGAEGGQQAARDGFGEARDALEQARRNIAQMQRAGSQGGRQEGKEGDSASGTGDDPTADDPEEVLLPAPEEFQTPEEYRNALLEGMSGQVPDEYEILNRRYYEELVRQ
jgi:hypothetical protein